MSKPLTAAEANYLFYKEFAADYEQAEPAVFGARQQKRFRAAIARALSFVPAEPQVLDACGGSGNAGVALARHGIIPVVVDVSPEMLALWRRKANSIGIEPEVQVSTIEEFLRGDKREWDLITFCSGLHHLEDFEYVLRLAAARLRPGGIIFTMFDPISATRALRLLRKLDWRAHLAATRPRRFLKLLGNALQRRAQSEDPRAYVGRMAERHVDAGIDDIALRAKLEQAGLTVLVHERYIDARLAFVRATLRLLGRPSQFHLVVQRRACARVESSSTG